MDNSMVEKNKNLKKHITVKLYELNEIKKIPINLMNGKDRSKLKHILKHEHFRLKKRDIDRLTQLLKNTKH